MVTHHSNGTTTKDTPATDLGAAPNSAPALASSADELLADFADTQASGFHEIATFSGGKERTFYIKELSIYEQIDVDTQRLKVEKGSVKRNPSYEAKSGLALELVATVMKKVRDATSTEPAVYEPFFTYKSAQALLMLPKANDMVSELLEWAYTYNPSLNPAKKAQAALAMVE